jgi:hypothetical protein
MREHVHYFQGFCRERENRGVAGGAEWIRTLSPGTGWALIEGMPKVLKPVAIYLSLPFKIALGLGFGVALGAWIIKKL